MQPFSLKDKTILITGASSGIGRATAVLCAQMGATVVVSGRNEHRLKETFEMLEGEGHQIFMADLSEEVHISELVKTLPTINGIFHSAGIVKPFPVQFIGEKQISEMFRINYNAPVILTSKILKNKKMEKGGSIVFMSSISSDFTHKGGALYAGTKAAINVFSKTVAIEFASKKIRSNCILAAMVKTPLFDQAEQAITKEMMDKHGEEYPLGFGEPEDIASAAVFLLSDASKWITGTNLLMDGGLTAG